MKAWRFYGFGDMRLDDVPEPVCRPGHVIAEPLCVQPSVTEAQLAFGIPTLAYEAIKRRLETEAPVQLFGHEFCARVVEVGEGVTRVRPGDRVAARAKLPCGACPFCLEGKNHLCRKGPIIGFQLPGCFAERALLPEIALVRVDDRISDSEAACLQSLSDSVAAVETAGIAIGDSVAIYRAGEHGPGVPPDRPLQRRGADRHRGRARGGLPGLPRARRRRRPERPGRRSRSPPSAS